MNMTISVLGTGVMGTALGQAILDSGIKLIAYNRTVERTTTLVEAGATRAIDATQAIADADISIFVMINGKAVLDTLKSVPADAIKGKIIISASSATIEEGKAMQQIIENAGGQFADMSIEIGPDLLSSSNGVVSLGASEATFAEIQPILSTFCADVKRIGNAGEARKLESIAVVGSMLAGINIAYMTAFAQKVGIASEVYEPYIAMFEPSASYVIDKMTAHNYDEVLASIENYVQGLNTSIENAEALNIPAGVLKESLKIYQKAVSMGYAGKDGTAVIEALLK
jgi:3-hydroxyisobutyrate dehydrogenase-like beta-hydroxyacid dehydrogenase